MARPAAGHRLDHQVGVACVDILPEPCKRHRTHSWGDDTIETGATEPSHATLGGASTDEHQTLRCVQVAEQLEAEMGDALGTFRSQRHTQR